jgi:nucleoside-diphosphate-sugar epimerase
VKAMNSPYRYDSSRIGRETGFTFEYGLEKGITRTVEWLNARGWL